MGDSEKKQGSGDIYIKASDPEDRKKLIETLEADEYKLDEEFPLTRQDVLESNLPVVVNSEKKV